MDSPATIRPTRRSKPRARKHATDVWLDQKLFVLDAERYEALVAALDNPPAAGAKLKALMKRRPLWQK